MTPEQRFCAAWNAFGIEPITTMEEADSLAFAGGGDLDEQIKELVLQRDTAEHERDVYLRALKLHTGWNDKQVSDLFALEKEQAQ